jgi:hypothetical protein
MYSQGIGMGIFKTMVDEDSRLGGLCREKASEIAYACQSSDNGLFGDSKAIATQARLNDEAVKIEPNHLTGGFLAGPNKAAKAKPRFGKFRPNSFSFYKHLQKGGEHVGD